MRKALIIGSRGNVGARLTRHLKRQGWQVLESDLQPACRAGYLMADINHPLDLLPAFDWQPDVVFMLAAMVSRVTCEQASGLALTTNLSGVNNVVQLCLRARARLVYFSTSEVYGPDCDVMDEVATCPRPNNRYGLSKLLSEQIVEYEVRSHGLSAVILRPFMIYDEAEELGDHRSAMIRFAANLAGNLPIEVHRGSARGWLHVDDAVRAIEAAAGVPEYAVINIGHPDIVPIEKLARLLCRRLGAAPDLIRLTELPGAMTLQKRPALKRQEHLLGFTPEISLREGVERVCRRFVGARPRSMKRASASRRRTRAAIDIAT